MHLSAVRLDMEGRPGPAIFLDDEGALTTGEHSRGNCRVA